MNFELENKLGVTILHLEGQGIFDYGAPENAPTKLTVTGVAADGSRLSVTFEAGAVRQLVALIRSIELELPGALRGH